MRYKLIVENLHSFSIILGEVSQIQAKVFLQFEHQLPSQNSIVATITGPRCSVAHTLPTTTTFQPVRSDQSQLHQATVYQATVYQATVYQATVVDPCFWSAQLPMIYDISLQINQGEQLVEERNVPVGIKSVLASGSNIYQEQRRIVLRGGFADLKPNDETPWQAWRESNSVVCLDCPTDEFCHGATQRGLSIIVFLNESDDLANEIRRLAEHAAVLMIIVSAAADLPDSVVRMAKRRVLLAQQCDPNNSYQVAPWAEVIACDDQQVNQAMGAINQQNKPVVVTQQALTDTPNQLEKIRKSCDELQKKLSGSGDFSGYLVNLPTRN